MKALLRAGMHRYLKHFAFRFGIAASLVAGLWFGWYYEKWGGENFEPNQLFFLLIVPAAICPIICCEYAERGFKNKITAGHSRIKIMLAETLLVLAESTLLFLAYTAGFAVRGYVRLSVLQAEGLWFTGVGFWLLIVSVGAMCFLISAAVKNRALAPILCILIIWQSYIVAEGLSMKLGVYTLPEEFDGVLSVENIDDVIKYNITGAKRAVMQAVHDIMPCGRLSQYSDMIYSLDPESGPPHISWLRYDMRKRAWLAPWSAGLTVIQFAAGYLIFKKKNIK